MARPKQIWIVCSWLLAAFVASSCGPLPASTKVALNSEDDFCREGTFEVGLGRDYAVTDDKNVTLTGSGDLAVAL
jgi:hypothetical protein